ncbi:MULTISPECIES: hypothetical protein [unclassified Coleofasciculus]|nr:MULTISPECIES: hypothetical protein [unclassified Coleofasciculus]
MRADFFGVDTQKALTPRQRAQLRCAIANSTLHNTQDVGTIAS